MATDEPHHSAAHLPEHAAAPIGSDEAAQEVARMVRHKIPVIIFWINNHEYAIEVAVHDVPYNNIKNWGYAGLIDVFNADQTQGSLWHHLRHGASERRPKS